MRLYDKSYFEKKKGYNFFWALQAFSSAQTLLRLHASCTVRRVSGFTQTNPDVTRRWPKNHSVIAFTLLSFDISTFSAGRGSNSDSLTKCKQTKGPADPVGSSSAQPRTRLSRCGRSQKKHGVLRPPAPPSSSSCCCPSGFTASKCVCVSWLTNAGRGISARQPSESDMRTDEHVEWLGQLFFFLLYCPALHVSILGGDWRLAGCVFTHSPYIRGNTRPLTGWRRSSRPADEQRGAAPTLTGSPAVPAIRIFLHPANVALPRPLQESKPVVWQVD